MGHDTPPPQDGKWIDGLLAAAPLADAARRVLAARLGAVERAGQNALQEIGNPEAVHELRVATRRARAAVEAFADVLPPRAARRVAKVLRKLRRAAGAARDGDVLLATLESLPSTRGARDQTGALFLTGYVMARQSGEREALLRSLTRLLDGKAMRCLRRVSERVRGEEDSTLGDCATTALPKLVAGFNEALAADTNHDDALHALRLIAKKLRYALEVFIDCYPHDVRDHIYPAIETLQGILGRANDSRQAARLITRFSDELAATRPELAKTIGPHLDAMVPPLDAAVAEQRRKLGRWRKKWSTLNAEERLQNPLPTTPGSAEAAIRP